MITVYASEQRGGQINITTDKACVPTDAIRVSTRVFPDEDSIMATAEMYFRRGFSVCVDLGKTHYEYEQ